MAEHSDILFVKKLSPAAILPTQGSPQAAGLDLYSVENCEIPPFEKKLIKTDIAIQLPPGTYGRIASRSGLAAEHSLTVGGGVIDPDYRGNLIVILFNHSSKIVHIQFHEKIAQLILERYSSPIVQESSLLSETSRNQAGFGSTG